MLLYKNINENNKSIIANLITSGKYVIEKNTLILREQRITTTFNVKNTDDKKTGLATLQISNTSESEPESKWFDEKTANVSPNSLKVISTNAARKNERLVIVTSLKSTLYAKSGDIIDIKDYLIVNTSENTSTAPYESQVSLKYESSNPNIPIDKNGILEMTSGSTVVKIYAKNVDDDNFLTIVVEEAIIVKTEAELRQALSGDIDSIHVGANIEIIETSGVLQINKPITLNGYKNHTENYNIIGDITFGSGSSNSELKNINIKENVTTGATGKIIIDPGTDGIITLTDVKNDGIIQVESGGYNSIYFYGITSSEIDLNCNSRIVLGEYVEMRTPCTISRIRVTSISEVAPDGTIQKAPKFEFTKSKVDEFHLSSQSKGSQLTLGDSSQIDTLDSYGEDSDFTVNSNGTLKTMNIYGKDTNVKVKSNGKIEYMDLKKDAEKTAVEVDTGGQINDAYVEAEYTSFSGDGAANIEVDSEVENPPVIDGYSVSGNIATISNSMGLYEALKNNVVTTIEMNTNIYTLIDKHLELNKLLTIKTIDGAVDKAALLGTITISSSNVTLNKLHIDARETFSAEISSSHSAIIINPTGETSLNNIEILNNFIQQDYKGITILNDASVVIYNNTITAVSKNNYVTNGIQIGDISKVNQIINASIDSNTVSGNFYNNVFLYAEGIYIKSSGTLTIDGLPYNISSQAEADNLGTALLSQNTIDNNEIKYYIINPSSAINEIWASEKGNLYNQLKNINLANTPEEMKVAIEDSDLALDLTEYNKLTEEQKLILAQELINVRPIEGFATKEEVQNEVDNLATEFFIVSPQFSTTQLENNGSIILSNYPFNLKITIKNKYEEPLSGIKNVLIETG